MQETNWEQAQRAERKYHDESPANFFEYMDSYRQYLKHFMLDFNSFKDCTVLEIGPADFPCVRYLKGIKEATVIEPMPSERLAKELSHCPAKLVKWPAEEVDFPEVDFTILFNVLQHVQDPYIIVEKAKRVSKRILFFEPLENGLSDTHLWNLTPRMFTDWFGFYHLYAGNPKAKNFHTANCAYGDWHDNV